MSMFKTVWDACIACFQFCKKGCAKSPNTSNPEASYRHPPPIHVECNPVFNPIFNNHGTLEYNSRAEPSREQNVAAKKPDMPLLDLKEHTPAAPSTPEQNVPPKKKETPLVNLEETTPEVPSSAITKNNVADKKMERPLVDLEETTPEAPSISGQNLEANEIEKLLPGPEQANISNPEKNDAAKKTVTPIPSFNQAAISTPEPNDVAKIKVTLPPPPPLGPKQATLPTPKDATTKTIEKPRPDPEQGISSTPEQNSHAEQKTSRITIPRTEIHTCDILSELMEAKQPKINQDISPIKLVFGAQPRKDPFRDFLNNI